MKTNINEIECCYYGNSVKVTYIFYIKNNKLIFFNL